MTWTLRTLRGKHPARAPEEPLPGAQWWTVEQVAEPDRPLVAGVAVLPVAVGAVTAVLGLMVLPVLVAAVALGSADHGAGRTGAIGPEAFAVIQSLACGLCLAAGSWLTGHLLRRAAVDRPAARRVAGVTGSLLAVLLVGHGLATGRPQPEAVAGLLLAGVLGSWAGAALGAGRTGTRPGAPSGGRRTLLGGRD